MTLSEFRDEFEIKYNLASFGAPELNNYEISLFLTQAVRDIVKELYPNYENSEFAKRSLGPLVKTKEICIETTSDAYSNSTTEVVLDNLEVIEDYYKGLITQRVPLPSDLWWILQEQVTFLNGKCARDVEVVAEDLDNVNKSIKNPFKKPTKRKVFRISDDGGALKLISPDIIKCYKVKYLKKYNPIILVNFADESDLTGNETIDGFNTVKETELPVFLHDEIIDRGVVLAIRALRNNNLQTQTQV